MTRPTALLLSPVRPDAQGNGLARRAWMWAATLAAGHELSTIVLAAGDWATEGRSTVPGTMAVLSVRRSPSPPDWIAADTELAAALRAKLPTQAPARILVFRLYLLDVVALLPPAWRDRIELDCDDREASGRLDLARLALRRLRPRTMLGHLRGSLGYLRAERRALRSLGLLYVAAEEDAAAMRRHAPPGVRVLAAPNRIAGTPAAVLVADPAPPRRLLFVGTLGYLPNEDAALWLAEAIAPRLRRLVPDAEIAVAGHGTTARLTEALARAGLRHLGAPESLAEAYAGACLAIAPLRGGSGTKFKVLEAWLHGRPVVVTGHACRGLGAVPDHHLLHADSAYGLAAACGQLLGDPALASRLAANGQALLLERFLVAPPAGENGRA